MAVSRPLLLALVGMVLAAATFYAARGARETATDPGASPTAATVAPAPSRAPAKPSAAPAEGERGARADKPAKAGKDSKADKPVRGRRERRAPSRVASKAPAAVAAAGVPKRVGQALRNRRVVVLFFRQRGADDAATAHALRSLRGLKRTSVFRDGIRHLPRYRAVVGGLGVAQAPAVVIVGKQREAQVVEGFVDAGTLKQLVLDAR